MASEYIAELHDIGKLVDKEKLEKIGIGIEGHTFTDFNLDKYGITKPSSPSWHAQFSDKVKDINAISVRDIPKEIRANILLTNIADVIAASISRTWGKKGQLVEGLRLLWSPDYYNTMITSGRKWAAFEDINGLREMFDFINNCQSSINFFQKYKPYLELTAEDKSAPLNIVSLYTHLELTGKIYRVLRKHSRLVEQNGNIFLEYNGAKISQLYEAAGGRINEQQKGKWIFRILKCSVFFPQNLFRLQDLNVFTLRNNLIREIVQKHEDYVLFFTSDFLCLFLPQENILSAEDIFKTLLEKGFIVDYDELEAELNLLTSSFEKSFNKFKLGPISTQRYLKFRSKAANPYYEPTITPDICDICQVRHGREVKKDQIKEYLCEQCSEIRNMGEPARGFATWEGKACWFKFTLDQGLLIEILRQLFNDYVENSSFTNDIPNIDKGILKESFRPLAVQISFVSEYHRMLEDFWKRIYQLKDENQNPVFTNENLIQPIDGYKEFGIFKYSSSKLFRATDLYTELIEEYFPECIDNCPIKLSMSIANVKYPYQEHWTFLSNPEDTINIQVIENFQLNLVINQYRALHDTMASLEGKLGHFLHRLSEIEIKTRSPMIVGLEVLDRRKDLTKIMGLQLQWNLTIQQILNFFKLAGGEEIVYKI